METTLKNKIDEIKKQAETLTAGERNQAIIHDLKSVISSLEPEDKQLKDSLNKRKQLETEPDDFQLAGFLEQEQNSRDRMQKPYSSLKDSFANNPDRIHQDGSVSTFIKAVKRYREIIRDNNKSTWEKWRKEHVQAFVSAAELASIKNIPNEKKAVDEYTSLMHEFNLSTELPSKKSEMQKIVQRAKRLKELKDGMDFNRPPKVKEFFKKLNQDGLIQLSKLDKETYTWLKDNDLLDEYVISRDTYSRGRY